MTEQTEGAPGRVLVAAVIAGTGAAITVPLTRPGIGWFIGAVVIAAAVCACGNPPPRLRRAPRSLATAEEGDPPQPKGNSPQPKGNSPQRTSDLPWRAGFGIAALALTATAGIRAAGWVVALCLLTAAAAGVLALVGGSRAPATPADREHRPADQERHPPDREHRPATTLAWAARGARAHRARLPRDWAGLAWGVGVGVALLVVFGGLFALADLDFRHAVDRAVPRLSLWRAVRAVVLFAAGAAATLVAARRPAGPAAAPPRPAAAPPRPAHRRLRRAHWVPALVMLDALFAWFLAIQLPHLFGGNRHVLEPGGPDFAVYARDGFFLLLVATLLTLVVIGVVTRYAAPMTLADRLLVGVLGALTLVVMASAAHRLALYVDAYGFTRARLTGAAVGAFLIAVLGLVLTARSSGRAVALAAVLTVLGFAVIDPDRVVADTVIQRYEKDGHLDAAYLAGLSVDAVPAIDRLPEDMRSCLLREVAADVGRDPWYAENLGRRRARAVLAARPAHDVCGGGWLSR